MDKSSLLKSARLFGDNRDFFSCKKNRKTFCILFVLDLHIVNNFGPQGGGTSSYSCAKCKFAQPQKVLKLTYLSFLFEGVPKYWTYSKTSGKRLEGVQNYLLWVNLKQIIYKRVFYKRKIITKMY